MNNESEDQRNSRIRDEQVQSRTRGPAQRSQQTSTSKKRSKSNQKSQPSRQGQTDKWSGPTPSGPLHLPLGGARDVAIGLAYGLIPAVLVALLLPGPLKLLGILVLGIAGAAGYMLGDAPPL